MNIFYSEHSALLKVLIEQKVSFIMIGGYVVNYYGYNRSTGDMDIWLKPNNSNKELLVKALSLLDFDDEGLRIISDWDFEKPQKFLIGDHNSPDRTDFMTHISGISYLEAEKNITIAVIDDLQIPIIHFKDLIKNKKSTGRLKDLSDVEYLEKILELKLKDGNGSNQ
jgi:predicted nucleotidyltransferase